MRNNKFDKFYVASGFFVIVVGLLMFPIKMGLEIGGSIGKLIILLATTIIVVYLIVLAGWYIFLTKFKN